MRIKSAVIAAAAVALMAGCSGGSSSAPSALPGGPVGQSMARGHDGDLTGVAPKFLQMLHFGHNVPVVPQRHKGGLKELAVSDFGTGAVEILNKTYALTGTITSGLNGPDGDFIDGKGNLYVANYAGVNVTEYPKGGTSPSFTYSTGLLDPVGVTTDTNGNVFVADYNSGSAGPVVEYPQGSNTPSATCSTGLANEGVVVDKSGHVFVSGNNPNTGAANIIEYSGGLSGCSGTTLGVSLSFAGGLQMDKHGNLVACDQLVGVDIIPAPYTTISSTITGASDSFHVALTENNKLVFIADPGNADVLVDKYPSGTNVKTLNGANGLSDPAGVATYPYQK